MKKIELNLEDFVPQEATFSLSTMPGKTLTLCRWSLRVRAWALDVYGRDKLQKILEQQEIVPIAQICYFMLKEKDQFGKLDEFLDHVTTPMDHLALVKALLHSMGVAEPKIEELRKYMHEGDEAGKKKERPKKKK